jgi:methyl-accepting chemotaxis protein
MTLLPNGNLGIGASAAAISPTYTLYVEGSAGKPGGGSWSNPSDRRLKDRISDYHDGIKSILKIKPVRFHYNQLSEFDTEPEHVGVIAQELREVAPYMVSENEQGYLDVNNSAMTYMLVNAVQELAQKNQSLEEQLQQQSDITNDLLKMMNEMQASNTELQNRMKQIEAALPELVGVQNKR